jgi:AcrR family transcriptional regulator
VERRPYQLGRRQAAADRTSAAIVAAGRDLAAAGAGAELSMGAVAARAGVSRLTLYNRFGSKAGLLSAIAQSAKHQIPGSVPRAGGDDARERLRLLLAESCAVWASDPALFRTLPAAAATDGVRGGEYRLLAESLAASDRLRPGCSLKEAEDVIGVLASFATFDLLHKDGRRSTVAVAEILMRLAGGILRQRDI